MDKGVEFEGWVEAARRAAATTRAKLDGMSFEDVAIQQIDSKDANGTNSLDRPFVDRLTRREHLDGSFLSSAA